MYIYFFEIQRRAVGEGRVTRCRGGRMGWKGCEGVVREVVVRYGFIPMFLSTGQIRR